MRFSSYGVCATVVSLATLVAFAGCGGAESSLPARAGVTPTPAATMPGATPAPTAKPVQTPTAAPAPTPTPMPSGTIGAMVSAAQITAAFADAESYYASLPHSDLASDLSATATHMTASGKFVATDVRDGGIMGTFPGGMNGMLFADRVEETGPNTGSYARRRAFTPPARQRFLTGASTSHEIAFLVNTTDTSGAFTPANQDLEAAAWTKATANAPAGSYEVDALPVTLENIVALGTGHPIDFVSLATHGMVPRPDGVHFQYVNISDTPITAASLLAYQSDLAAGTLFAGTFFTNVAAASAGPTFAFTPAYVATHLHFNPGALFVNESCYGQAQQISLATTAVLSNDGVGRYLGWSLPVVGADADQSDAFLVDRLLGEPTSALGAIVTQRNPAQRPFQFSDVLGAMGSETRAGAGYTAGTYLVSTPARTANFVTTFDTAIAIDDDDLVVPSIATMAVTEKNPTSTLTIDGEFPAAKGTVFDAVDGSAQRLAIESWSASEIVVDLPASGPGSAGLVSVVAVSGLASPGVPLTYWHGTFAYTEKAVVDDFASDTGTGSGGLNIAMDLGIRADVAPVVPAIDVAPVSQNFVISDVTPDSTASLSGYQATFTSSDSSKTAKVTSPGSTALVPYGATLPYGTADYFELSTTLDPVNGSPCNNGKPGPQGGAGNVACPGFQYAAIGAATCNDNQSGRYCAEAAADGASIGKSTSQFGDDQDYDSTPSTLTFTLNPSTYAIAVKTTAGSIFTENYSNFAQIAQTITGSFSAPVAAP